MSTNYIKIQKILFTSNILDPLGWIIRLYTKCQWHHVAWMITDNLVIEVNGRGTNITDMNKYKKWYYKTKIVYIDLDLFYRVAIETRLLSYKNKKGYLYLLISFVKLLFNIPLTLQDKPTCSGLLYYSLFPMLDKLNKTPKHILEFLV